MTTPDEKAIPRVTMVCKTSGQEDGRPTEALLRADLVEARREIEQLQAELAQTREVLDAIRGPAMGPDEVTLALEPLTTPDEQAKLDIVEHLQLLAAHLSLTDNDPNGMRAWAASFGAAKIERLAESVSNARAALTDNGFPGNGWDRINEALSYLEATDDHT